MRSSQLSAQQEPIAPSSPPIPLRRKNALSLRESVFPGSAFNNNVNVDCPAIRFSNFSSVSRIPLESPIIEEEIFEEVVVVSSVMAWLILFYSIFNSAIIPAWLMGNLQSETFTRNSWRYFMLAVLALPFALYEQRRLRQKNQTANLFLAKLTWDNLLRSYKRSLHFMLWLFLYVLACKLTSMNHACHLTNLMTFFLSIIRVFTGGRNHEYEKGGAGLILFGMLLIFYDSLTMPYVEDAPDNQRFLESHPLLRLLGDLLCILASFLLAYLNETVPPPTFQPFSRFFVGTLINYLNLATFGYFFGASELNRNSLYGLFGLFTLHNFVMVFYVSIMLGIGLMLSNILINQMFSESIRAMAGIFEPLVTSIIYHMLALEPVPSGLTCIGFSFMVPGQLMIVAGQSTLHQKPALINFILRADH